MKSVRGLSRRRSLFVTVSALALVAGAAAWLKVGQGRAPEHGRCSAEERTNSPAINARPIDTVGVTRRFLLYFIVPLWLTAGVADWICHRAANIEQTTGPKESLLHLLMLAEVGVPVTAALLFEITTPVAALMLASFFVHEATALWDVSYAVTKREVTPIEQHVHSFPEMVPLMALSFVAVLHWPQFRALLGLAAEATDRAIRFKEEPLPGRYVTGTLGATTLFELVPYLEELYRTLRASHGRLVPEREPR
jgi:hypothetical protein